MERVFKSVDFEWIIRNSFVYETLFGDIVWKDILKMFKDFLTEFQKGFLIGDINISPKE